MAQTKEGAEKIAAKRAGLSVDEFRTRNASGLKRCTRCKEWRGRGEFGVDPCRFDGLASTCGPCRRVKVRKCWKGRVSTFKGHHHSAESKAKLSAALTGKPGPRKGIPRTPEERAKMRAAWKVSPKAKRGVDHPNYKHGLAQRAFDDRRRPEYREWRGAVFTRDHHTCQKCGDAKGGNLRAHHIVPFASHPELRFDVANGLTLCHPCHEAVHLKSGSIRNVRKLKRGEPLYR